MSIDWNALILVAIVSIVATVVFVVLLALAVRFLSAGKAKANGTAALTAGYAFLATGGLLVLFCLYLIIPQFHR